MLRAVLAVGTLYSTLGLRASPQTASCGWKEIANLPGLGNVINFNLKVGHTITTSSCNGMSYPFMVGIY